MYKQKMRLEMRLNLRQVNFFGEALAKPVVLIAVITDTESLSGGAA